MNKIEKFIVESICREFQMQNSPIMRDSKKYKSEIKLPLQRISANVGISFDDVDKVIQSLVKQGYIRSSQPLEDETGWSLEVIPDNLAEMLDDSLKGNKLTQSQSRFKMFFASTISSARMIDMHNKADTNIKKAFNEGKWLRYCCSACGDFIQEIKSYDELKKLELDIVECKRYRHKNTFKIDKSIINFSSVNVNIFELFKDKKN